MLLGISDRNSTISYPNASRSKKGKNFSVSPNFFAAVFLLYRYFVKATVTHIDVFLQV